LTFPKFLIKNFNITPEFQGVRGSFFLSVIIFYQKFDLKTINGSYNKLPERQNFGDGKQQNKTRHSGNDQNKEDKKHTQPKNRYKSTTTII
jgi:hypothetical protein